MHLENQSLGDQRLGKTFSASNSPCFNAQILGLGSLFLKKTRASFDFSCNINLSFLPIFDDALIRFLRVKFCDALEPDTLTCDCSALVFV